MISPPDTIQPEWPNEKNNRAISFNVTDFIGLLH
jgi:hypothetical protein